MDTCAQCAESGVSLADDSVIAEGLTVADKASARVSARLKWTILAIIVLMAGALGLKAWEERQSADIAMLSTLEGDARAIAGRLEGRADTAETLIRLVADTGSSRSAITAAAPGIDTVLSLSDAQQSPAGSRLGEAAETAASLLENGHRLGISGQGDIVLVSTPASGTPMLAIAPAATWLPAQLPASACQTQASTRVRCRPGRKCPGDARFQGETLPFRPPRQGGCQRVTAARRSGTEPYRYRAPQR